jgi:membrane-anchored protein YejM (alkaline phosphatase superfamily)
MIFRAILIWVLLLGFAVLNGTVREFALAPRMGAQAAHVASTLVLCAVIFVVALLFTRWIAPKSRGGALLTGAVWLALTLAFEFLAGHYLFGSSWQRLLSEYDLMRGRVWILVLVATLFAPVWAFGWSRASR